MARFAIITGRPQMPPRINPRLSQLSAAKASQPAPMVPCSRPSNVRTSPRLSTAGRRVGEVDRNTRRRSPTGIASTSRHNRINALKACICVERATRRSAARCVRNAMISLSPSSRRSPCFPHDTSERHDAMPTRTGRRARMSRRASRVVHSAASTLPCSSTNSSAATRWISTSPSSR